MSVIRIYFVIKCLEACVCVCVVGFLWVFFAGFIVVTLFFLINAFNTSLLRVPMKSYPRQDHVFDV